MLVYGHSISLISIKQIPLPFEAGEFVLNTKHNLSLSCHFKMGADKSLLLSSLLFLPSDESDNFFSACLHYILKLAGTIADLVGSEEIQSAQLAQSSEDTD